MDSLLNNTKCKDLIFNKDTKFLVTGGAGFIGSNLCETIIKLGYKVRCFDNFSTGKHENIEHLKVHPMFEFIEGDIRDYEMCFKICNNIDFVLHQAAIASVPESIEMPLLYADVNINGTINMMEAARQSAVKKIVYASSSAVYGDEPTLPKVEGKEGKALSPYALTKQINEEYGKIYTELYGLDTYGLRYFNVFGKRQDPNGAYAAVIPKFISQLLNDEQSTIYGDGKQSRDFTYVENVIEANLKACLASKEVAGQSFNIAFGKGETLIDMYNYLCDKLEERTNLAFGEERKGDIKHSIADINKARKLLGYNPEVSFSKGIDEVIEWYVEESRVHER
jgi:UDP-N-acetylglucosamine 4-epimerase